MPRYLWLAGLLMVAMLQPAQANELDLNLNNDTIRLSYLGDLSSRGAMKNATTDIGFLYTDNDPDDVYMGHAGIMVFGDAGAQKANIRVGLGGRLQYLDAGAEDAFALSIGASAIVRVPGFERIGGGAYIQYAPDVTSFSNLEQFLEYGITVDYQILRPAYVYLGYRQIKIDVERTGSFTVDTGLHVGLKLQF